MNKPFLDWDRWIGPASIGIEWLDCAIGSALLGQLSTCSQDEWIDFIDQNRMSQGGSISDDFRNWLTTHFDGIRAIHATRLPDLSGVKKDGLRAWTPAELAQNAEIQFGSIASATAIALAVKSCAPHLRGGRVYLFSCLSEALGLDSPSNGKLSFAVRGSEFRECVARHLGSLDNAGQEQAYLLVCHLAWSKIESHVIDIISQDALTCILTTKCCPTHNSRLRTLECVSTTQNIQPSEIVEYANVDALVDRDDLSTSKIEWQPF